eukprot:TRINITY_DN67676_c0_g1_i1.p1 TRINITY_DN67676_c0_g1~~TRINITY_DN67676_c0_g1_i1.p1  ORF type:complete len:381 (+),score=98.27 TRINITY_DN67676_c0_g1_i1:127-1143(+)
MALLEIERQKILLATKETHDSDMHQTNEKNLKHIEELINNQPLPQLTQEDDFLQQPERLQAHKLLVEKSNQRILARLNSMKNKRQSNTLGKIQKPRFGKQKETLKKRPTMTESIKTKLAQKLRMAITSPTVKLSKQEQKKALEWLDLKRNAAIMQKTDKAIAEKLKGKTAALSLGDISIINVDSALGEYEYDHDYYEYEDEEYDYENGVTISNTGSKFLTEVADILGQAESSLDYGEEPHVTLSGSLRASLLRDVDDRIRTEMNKLPGGRVSTKVSLRNQRPFPQRNHINRSRLTNQNKVSALSKALGHLKSKGTRNQTFSEIMGDLLVGKPSIPGLM